MGIAPEAVGAMPGLGGPGMPDPSGPPPMPGDQGSMAMLAALLQGGGGAPPMGGDPMGGGDPLAGLGGGEDPLAGLSPPGQRGTDLMRSMSSTDHIRAAIKHLMMGLTESEDDEESHGIGKGMTALHAILAGKAKNAKTIQAAGG